MLTWPLVQMTPHDREHCMPGGRQSSREAGKYVVRRTVPPISTARGRKGQVLTPRDREHCIPGGRQSSREAGKYVARRTVPPISTAGGRQGQNGGLAGNRRSRGIRIYSQTARWLSQVSQTEALYPLEDGRAISRSSILWDCAVRGQ
jgi:hypothetical protein